MKKTALITQHNQQQRRYFEAALKPTMRPADTPYIRRQADEVLRFGDLTRGDRILEVGCGMGRYTFYLLRRGYRVEGLELSPVQVEWFKAFDGGSYGVPVHCGDILDYGTRFAGRFDAVIGFFVLHHLHNLCACFSSMARILKPGGRMVFFGTEPFQSSILHADFPYTRNDLGGRRGDRGDAAEQGVYGNAKCWIKPLCHETLRVFPSVFGKSLMGKPD